MTTVHPTQTSRRRPPTAHLPSACSNSEQGRGTARAALLHSVGRLLLAAAVALPLALPLAGAAVAASPAKPTRAWPAARACPGPALHFEPLAPGLWWLPAATGDANANNRGQVSNLVLALQGRRAWLLGSGPTPAFGRALACHIQQRWGLAVTDVISPWPHPSLVLGVAGLEDARAPQAMQPLRHWAHADVASAMQQRCAGCAERLRTQLGEAASDMRSNTGSADPVRAPQRLLHGSQGRLGPWRWWLLSRGEGFPVTVWQWQQTPLLIAPGLLWDAGAPDARDADIQTLAQSTRQLHDMQPQQPMQARQPPRALREQQVHPAPRRAAAPTPTLRWLGEQGPPGPARQPATHLLYWYELVAAVRAAQARGDLETDAAPPVAHQPASDPQHALNWQRAWRQVEAEALQRSLR